MATQITLPSGLVLARGDLPRLAIEQQIFTPKYAPEQERRFRGGSQWVGTSQIRSYGHRQQALAEEIVAVLNALQDDSWAEWPLNLPTFDAALPGSLALNNTSTAPQADGTVHIVFSSLSKSQRDNKLRVGQFLRWGGLVAQIVRLVASTSSLYIRPGLAPAKVIGAYPVLQPCATLPVRIDRVEHPRDQGLWGPWSVAYRSYRP